MDAKIVIALDFDDLNKALYLADSIDPQLARLKVGKALFTRFGVEAVQALQKHGFEIFLDLKYHDIPNTVADAVRAAADLGVWMVNVHASGGAKMLSAAVEALAHYQEKPHLIAVTVLTSMREEELLAIGVQGALVEQVARLTQLAFQSGLDGVVCSAQEAASVKANTAANFLTVCPGIRPAGSDIGDQSRIMTPIQALQNGADYLVIGRPITQAENPAAMLAMIQQSFNEREIS